MSKITEVSVWEPTIYQWDVTDPNKAGPAFFDLDGEATDGFANAGVQQLTNRTLYLKETQDTDIANLTAHIGSRGAAHTNATQTEAGFMSASDKTKLNGVADGAQANVGTNLSVTGLNTSGFTLSSSTGTGAAIPSASTSTAGLMTGADKNKLNNIEVGAQVNTVISVAARTGAVVLTKTDVGLANVDNTSDVNKPVSTATQTALNLKANLASPALTGTPTAPTATAGTNTTQLATTAFVTAAVTAGGSGTTNLGVTTAASTTTITSSTGTSAVIPAATTSLAGVLTASDKTKLDGIQSGAQANVATNLAQGTRTATTVPVTSSTGTSATLDIATTSLAGVMSAADKTKLDGLSPTSASQFAQIQDQKTRGTSGGPITGAAYTKRDLNTLVLNEITSLSLASGTSIITVPAGTYYVECVTQFQGSVQGTRLRLQNTTDASTLLIGVTAYSALTNINTSAHLHGKFTVTGTKTIELQYFCQGTVASAGGGLAGSTGTADLEIYSDLRLWKLS